MEKFNQILISVEHFSHRKFALWTTIPATKKIITFLLTVRHRMYCNILAKGCGHKSNFTSKTQLKTEIYKIWCVATYMLYIHMSTSPHIHISVWTRSPISQSLIWPKWKPFAMYTYAYILCIHTQLCVYTQHNIIVLASEQAFT